MEKSSVVQVTAYLQVGMLLTRKHSSYTAPNGVFARTVTAIGVEYFLALDSNGKEHPFPIGSIDDYKMDGWDLKWREVGEKQR